MDTYSEEVRHTSIPQKRLEMVHLQLTDRCNLNCWFCGQRKKPDKSMYNELSSDEWIRILDSLNNASARRIVPSVTVWGGEAELSPAFTPVLEYLHASHFHTALITNGTLINHYSSIISRCIEKLYVSIDGNEKIHDSIRGNGVFSRVKDNLSLLHSSSLRIVIMTVITDETAACLDEILESFSVFHPSEVILQDMISLEPEEVLEYKAWLFSRFGIHAKEIDSWAGSPGCHKSLTARRRHVEKAISHAGKYSFRIRYLPHGICEEPYCLSPFRHLCIGSRGDVYFCTDFTDFSIGNVRNNTLDEIFTSTEAEMWRNEILHQNCAVCRHCSWPYKKDYTCP